MFVRDNLKYSKDPTLQTTYAIIAKKYNFLKFGHQHYYTIYDK